MSNAYNFGVASNESIQTIRYKVGLPNLKELVAGIRLKFVSKLLAYRQ